MMRIIAGIVACLMISSPASAWIHGAVSGVGNAQVNLGPDVYIPSYFVNVLKTATVSYSSALDIQKTDATGYLTGTPAGDVNINFAGGGAFSGVTYKLNWGSGVRFSSLVFNTILSGCSVVGDAAFSGCSGASTTVSTNGGAGSMTFTLPGSSFSMKFSAGSTNAHTGGELALYRTTDETDYQNGVYWTTEARDFYRSLHPRTLRMMGLDLPTQNFSGETTWSNRMTTSNLTWNASSDTKFIVPSAITQTKCNTSFTVCVGTNTTSSSAYTAAAASGTPGSWTDGEQYTGVIDTTSLATNGNVTLDIGGRGAKTVKASDASSCSTGCLVSGTIYTFTYDAFLGVLLRNGNGVVAGMPIEAQIQLANLVNANLWVNLPQWALDSYVTSWSDAVCSGLNAGLIPYFEYSNEVWLFTWPQTNWVQVRGNALGLTSQPVLSYYGLRVRQVMGNLLPASCAARSVRRVMAYQGAPNGSNPPDRFRGAELNPASNSVLCTFLGGTFSGSCSGAPNYSAAVSAGGSGRPIDVAETLSIAPYVPGTNLCESPDANCTPTANNVPFYNALVAAWDGGDTAGAVALVDDDIRQGRILVQNVTASGTTFTTPAAHGFTAGSSAVAFKVTGGTASSGIVIGQLYLVNSVSSAGCPGAVTCNFTIQAYSGGVSSGVTVNAGAAGSGTMSIGVSGDLSNSTFGSIVFITGRWEGYAEGNAACYDGLQSSPCNVARPAGMAPLRTEWYEGNLEPATPSAAQCTSLGVSGANPCGPTGSIAQSIAAWKASSSAKATQQVFYNWFMGNDASFPATFGIYTHSQTPSQLVGRANCSGTDSGWATLLLGCLPNSGLTQVGLGFQAFSAP